VTKLSPIRSLLALLPLALLLAMAATALAADTYEAAWNGGHLTATANADFTEATIESVSVSFDGCGTQPDEASCIWEATATLHSHDYRCNPATPEDQVVWDSGSQSGNGTVSDGPISIALEGCRGQSLVFQLESHKTYEEGTMPPWRVIRSGSIWPLFTFGYHPVEEMEQRIINESPPATLGLPPIPDALTVSPDCRSLTIGNVTYIFDFRRMGCHKASNLAKMRHISAQAPDAYHCRNVRSNGGVLCWRIGHAEKYLEWRLPGTTPTRHRS
jgi:hypothetical protein